MFLPKAKSSSERNLQDSTGPSILHKQANTLPDLGVKSLPYPGMCDPIDLMGNPFNQFRRIST